MINSPVVLMPAARGPPLAADLILAVIRFARRSCRVDLPIRHTRFVDLIPGDLS
jgi:hypothetical protein